MTTSHFTRAELQCHCGCRGYHIEPGLLTKLEALRTAVGGAPIHVHCAYRCPKHNAEVGGVPGSYHLKGMAADIHVEGLSPTAVADAAISVGFTGIGIYSTFTHVDIRPTPARWRG